MKHFHYFSIFAIGALAIAGCGNDGTITNPPPSTPTQVTYVKGTTYTYYEQKLDVSGNVVAGSGDTIRSTVVTTDTAYRGKTHVTALANTHTNGSANDTTYIAQTAGEYWHYNYGLESANTNTTVLAFNGGKPLVAGWVLEGKFTAQSGDQWKALDTTVILPIASATLRDTAKEAQDESILVGVTPVTCKHVQHSGSVSNAAVGAVGTSADAYLSADYGVVRNIIHPANGVVNGSAIQAEGRQTFLLKKN